MNIVLYTHDMEPITIINLPLSAIEFGESQRFVSVAVPMKPRTSCLPNEPIDVRYRKVELEFHKIINMNRRTSWFVTVQDEETALMLTPSWLPGQRGAINKYERDIKDLSSMLLKALRGSAL